MIPQRGYSGSIRTQKIGSFQNAGKLFNVPAKHNLVECLIPKEPLSVPIVHVFYLEAITDMKPFGQGMGAVGLPGDASPASRFVRAAFVKWNSRARREEKANVSQFFHILDSVAMVRGMVLTEEGREDITTYSCCVNARTGVYYFKTYDNHRIQAVDMRAEDMDGSGLLAYELPLEEDIQYRLKQEGRTEDA